MTEAIVQKCSVRKAVLRNFTNFIFNKVAGLREVAGLNSGLNSLFLKRFFSLGRKATSGIQCFFINHRIVYHWQPCNYPKITQIDLLFSSSKLTILVAFWLSICLNHQFVKKNIFAHFPLVLLNKCQKLWLCFPLRFVFFVFRFNTGSQFSLISC